MKKTKTKVVIMGLAILAACIFFYPLTAQVSAAQDMASEGETEDTAVLSAKKSTSKWTKVKSGKFKGTYESYKTGRTTYKIKASGVLTKNKKTVSLKKYNKKTITIGGKCFYVKKSGGKYVIDRKKGWKKDKTGKYTYYISKTGVVSYQIKASGALAKNGKTVSLKKYYKKTIQVGSTCFYVKKSGKNYVIDRTKGFKKDQTGKYTYYVDAAGAATYKNTPTDTETTENTEETMVEDTTESTTETTTEQTAESNTKTETSTGTMYYFCGKCYNSGTYQPYTTVTEFYAHMNVSSAAGESGHFGYLYKSTTAEEYATWWAEQQAASVHTVHRFQTDYTAYKDYTYDATTGVYSVSADDAGKNETAAVTET